MRILHVLPSLDADTGGPAKSVPALCQALQTAGKNAVLYTFSRKGTSAENDQFPITRFSPLAGTRQVPTPSYYTKLSTVISSYDLVHLHSLWNAAISATAFACRRHAVPYVISPRGMLQEGALRRRRAYKALTHRLLEKRTIAGASFLHFFTRTEANDSRRLIGNSKVVIIPNGIDPALAESVKEGQFRQKHPETSGKRIILFLGRLHWSKGLELQIDALARLAAEFPDLLWVFAGPDEGEQAKLLALVQAKNLTHRVLWTGMLSRQESLAALADATAFVLSSRHEAHSMAMNEALAMGTPVVITESVGFSEVGEAGAGLVVPSTGEALAEGLRRLLRNPQLASEMRQKAKEYASTRLAWPKVAAAMIDAYASVLKRQPAVPTCSTAGAA